MLQGREFADELSLVTGYPLHDIDLYVLAFTHKSADGNGTSRVPVSYDRLEFIGDAVINLVVAHFLFLKYPDQAEGYLTRLRTKLVSGNCLSHISKCLCLHKFIRMNSKAINNGWQYNDRILEDVFEALVAAISLDQGLPAAQHFVMSCMTRYVAMHDIETEDNYKDVLMRYTQAEGIGLPIYNSCERFDFGRRQYEITTCIQRDGAVLPVGFGVACTKKKAEQEAARHALSSQLLNGR